MRTIMGICICILTLAWSTTGFAYTWEIKQHVPQEYLLIVVNDADPDKPIDKNYIMTIADKAKEYEVAQLEIAVYDKGKTYGDGARAVYRKLNTKEEAFAVGKEEGEYSSRHYFNQEKYIGLFVMPARLVKDFTEDKAAAQKLYEENTFLLCLAATRVTRDKSGAPYVEEVVNDKGHRVSVKAFLKESDEFLREVKRGEVIVIRGKITHVSDAEITLRGRSVNMLDKSR